MPWKYETMKILLIFRFFHYVWFTDIEIVCFTVIGASASARRVLWNRVRLSVLQFSRDWLIVFSENYYDVRGPHIVVCGRAKFFGKNLYLEKMTKNGQKCPRNMVFGLFKKVTSLVFSGICVKWKFVWFINILRKLHTWQKSGSQIIAKNGSRQMRFQYSWILNISLID